MVSPSDQKGRTAPDFTARHSRLHESLGETGLAAMAFNPGPTLTYLTGLHFHLSERPVIALFTPDAPPALVLPELETAKLSGLSFEVEAFPYGEDPTSWPAAFRRAAEAAGVADHQVGVEPRRMRVLELRLLEKAAPAARFVSGEASVASLRMYKDAHEVALMREAVVIAETAVQETVARLEKGITEREVAAELTLQMLRAGSEAEFPFAPIVSFGAESANPHAVPRDVALDEGDLVLIDWGANVHGYFSDLTRMFGFGTPVDELVDITRIVREANAAGRAAARPGATAAAVDRAARKVIEDAGFGAYFIHRTGHGLGLESHEEPYIRGDNEQVLEEGMAFTVEPGIYLPGRGGARIEDDLVVTVDGAESLSTLTRDLVTVG